jgi:subtilisin family serine protease
MASPDPTKRPHVVNNSWGGGGGDPWYQGVVNAWRAAGIFPAFSIGNAGSSCGTAGSPGDYAISFASGATDLSDNIANFSSRGPSAFGGIIKPDVAAPGVNVRSSIANGSYAAFNGTSMASPHTAGIVALLWSEYPGLVRDIPNTEKKLRPATQILNSTQGCGGLGATAHPNHVYGWGRLDSFQGWTPFNVYTNRSVFNPGDSMNVFLSLVNPTNSAANVDLYLAVKVPSGDVLFYPGFTTTATPFASNFAVAPLVETFDFNVFNHVFGAETAGDYKWYSVITRVGRDVFDSANWLSIDEAPFRKN